MSSPIKRASSRRRLGLLLLHLAALLFAIWACHLEARADQSVLNVGALTDTLGKYDSVRIVIKDKDGKVIDTAFSGKISDKSDLESLPVPHYHGEKVVIEITGFNGGVEVLRV